MFRKPLILTLFIAILISSISVALTASVTEAPYTRNRTHVAQYPSMGTVPDIRPTLPPGVRGDLKLTILIDNTVYKSYLKSESGFATLLEYGGHTLLFDTGVSGFNLLRNMEQLSMDPRSIEAVTLSHEHDDHTGGLQTLLGTGARPPVYTPSSFPDYLKERVRVRTKLIEVTSALEIFPGVHTTRPVGTIVEQALVIETKDGTVVFTGCAHPGVVEIVKQAQEVVKGEISLLVGGFHLKDHTKNQLLPIIAELRKLGVKNILPTHCTGGEAIALFRAEYGRNYVEGGVGRTWDSSAK